MTPPHPPIREWHGISRMTFEQEIVPTGVPAILRGLVADWPVARAAAHSSAALAAYLKQFDRGAMAGALVGHPGMGGRYFYDAAMRGFNFDHRKVPFAAVIDQLLAIADTPDAMAIYAGSVSTHDTLPGFAAANPMPLLEGAIEPRVWVGNAARIAAHFDIANNIACAVGGRRRFTVFAPDQISNLYIGPLDFNMAGQPASMVDFAAPDFEKFPRFRDALAAAIVVDLAPGDGLYLPTLWWHHVESFGAFNLLVNYWWGSTGEGPGFEALILALLGIRDRPAPERAAWRAYFEHYVFGDTAPEAAAHLPEHARSVLGPPHASRTAKMLDFLIARLRQR